MPSAERELEEACLWIAERAPEPATAWYNGALKSFLKLEGFPERCPLASESGFFDHDIRQLLYARATHAYRSLFDISRKKVRILHIRYGARNYLKGDLPENG